MQVNGEQIGMATTYFSNITALLLMIVTVCEKDINLHLQTERDMLKHIFVFHYQDFFHVTSLMNLCF